MKLQNDSLSENRKHLLENPKNEVENVSKFRHRLNQARIHHPIRVKAFKTMNSTPYEFAHNFTECLWMLNRTDNSQRFRSEFGLLEALQTLQVLL